MGRSHLVVYGHIVEVVGNLGIWVGYSATSLDIWDIRDTNIVVYWDGEGIVVMGMVGRMEGLGTFGIVGGVLWAHGLVWVSHGLCGIFVWVIVDAQGADRGLVGPLFGPFCGISYEYGGRWVSGCMAHNWPHPVHSGIMLDGAIVGRVVCGILWHMVHMVGYGGNIVPPGYGLHHGAPLWDLGWSVTIVCHIMLHMVDTFGHGSGAPLVLGPMGVGGASGGQFGFGELNFGWVWEFGFWPICGANLGILGVNWDGFVANLEFGLAIGVNFDGGGPLGNLGWAHLVDMVEFGHWGYGRFGIGGIGSGPHGAYKGGYGGIIGYGACGHILTCLVWVWAYGATWGILGIGMGIWGMVVVWAYWGLWFERATMGYGHRGYNLVWVVVLWDSAYWVVSGVIWVLVAGATWWLGLPHWAYREYGPHLGRYELHSGIMGHLGQHPVAYGAMVGIGIGYSGIWDTSSGIGTTWILSLMLYTIMVDGNPTNSTVVEGFSIPTLTFYLPLGRTKRPEGTAKGSPLVETKGTTQKLSDSTLVRSL
ncbi:hypothetical protein G9A89_000261 [Geosiphon pyriformis]|nr:hypothetical protein G9A89_000261 [Geosiphon pyriformis]